MYIIQNLIFFHNVTSFTIQVVRGGKRLVPRVKFPIRELTFFPPFYLLSFYVEFFLSSLSSSHFSSSLSLSPLSYQIPSFNIMSIFCFNNMNIARYFMMAISFYNPDPSGTHIPVPTINATVPVNRFWIVKL